LFAQGFAVCTMLKAYRAMEKDFPGLSGSGDEIRRT